MSKIYFLPVKHGDAFIIECVRGDTQGLVVVDGGPRSCGFELKRKLNELGTPDLMVLTHYDEDHIGGYWWLAHFSRFCHLQIIDIQQYYKTMYRDTNP